MTTLARSGPEGDTYDRAAAFTAFLAALLVPRRTVREALESISKGGEREAWKEPRVGARGKSLRWLGVGA